VPFRSTASGIPDDFTTIPLLEKFHHLCQQHGDAKVQDRIRKYTEENKSVISEPTEY